MTEVDILAVESLPPNTEHCFSASCVLATAVEKTSTLLPSPIIIGEQPVNWISFYFIRANSNYLI